MFSVCAGKIESNALACANRGFADHEYLQINGRFWWVFTAGDSQKFNLSQFSRYISEQLFRGKNHYRHAHCMSTRYFDTQSCKIKMADSFVWTVLHEGLGGSCLPSLIFFGILGESVKLWKTPFWGFQSQNW